MARRAAAAVASLNRLAGKVEKGKAPTLFRKRLEIGLDENLDGLVAGMNFDTNRCVAKVNLVAASVLSSNDGVRHQSSRLHSLAWDIWRIVFTTTNPRGRTCG